jgi:hypothetical protein
MFIEFSVKSGRKVAVKVKDVKYLEKSGPDEDKETAWIEVDRFVRRFKVSHDTYNTIKNLLTKP